MSRPNQQLAVGQIRQQVRLGSEAVYRVRDWDDATVSVEVVRAAGLEPGAIFKFARTAVETMDVMPDETLGA